MLWCWIVGHKPRLVIRAVVAGQDVRIRGQVAELVPHASLADHPGRREQQAVLDVVCLAFRGSTLGGASGLGGALAQAMTLDVALACPLGLSL